ncbi:MAG TPA: HAMP domain-containing protein, partial [Pyrinomonadaceae bacterium]|nr:HAMP domain-containing protein [Pyrinomonadaceae bacterium]
MKENRDELSELKPVRRRGAPWLFGGLVLLLLSVLVVLQLFGLWEIFTPDRASDTLLIYALSTLNFVAFFLFSFIFIRSLLKLRRERRERQLGSKIKTRLVVYFIAVSLLPITAMALFSFMFFNRSLEKWFGSFPQDVVSQAKLAQEENDQTREQSLRLLADTFAVAIADRAEAPSDVLLSTLAARGNLAFVAIVSGEDAAAQQVAFNDRQPLEKNQLDSIARRAKESGSEVFNAEAAGVSYEVAQTRLPTGQLLVVARERKAGDSLNNLIARAQSFEDFKGNQRKVRLLGLSTLGLLTLMLLFAATWSAIHLARGIGAPIRALAEASKEVAAGNLEYRVTAIADDELAVLASAFNDMTGQLAENRRRLEANASELRDKNLALEERRHYIETVLQTVSTGVVSLDEENRVTTINSAALSMLRLEQTPAPQTPLAEILSAGDYEVLERVLWRARTRGRATEQMELARGPAQDASGAVGGQTGGSVIPVALTATALTPRADEVRHGVVLVIEDLSELLAAQRAAAWSEVARRLAHEIKNP